MNSHRVRLVLATVGLLVAGFLMLGPVPGVSRRVVITVVGVAAAIAAVAEVRQARTAWVDREGVAVGRREAMRHGVVAAVAALIAAPLLLLVLAPRA